MLPDGKTVLGPSNSSRELVVEDITTKYKKKYSKLNDFINTFLYDETSRSLFMGDNSGNVVQWKRKKGSNAFAPQKDYGDLGVGPVLSCTQVADYVLFGGNNGRIRVVDVRNQTLLEGSVETALGSVYSLEACPVDDFRIFLSVSGASLDYSLGRTDVFELSGMFITDPKVRSIYFGGDLAKARETIFRQHLSLRAQEDTISDLTQKMKQFEKCKRHLRQQESRYRVLDEKHKFLLSQNEGIRNKLLLLKPEVEDQTSRLTRKILILDKLRRRYTRHLHKSIEVAFFQEDQYKIISDLKEENRNLTDLKNLNHHCLEQSRKIQKKYITKSKSLNKKVEENQKSVLGLKAFIRDR